MRAHYVHSYHLNTMSMIQNEGNYSQEHKGRKGDGTPALSNCFFPNIFKFLSFQSEYRVLHFVIPLHRRSKRNNITVLKLEGNKKIGAHLRNNHCNMICVRH